MRRFLLCLLSVACVVGGAALFWMLLLADHLPSCSEWVSDLKRQANCSGCDANGTFCTTVVGDSRRGSRASSISLEETCGNSCDLESAGAFRGS